MQLISITLFLVLASIHTALAIPPATLFQPRPKPSNTTVGDVIPYCFDQTSHPGIGYTNYADCRRAMTRLIREPRFTTSFRFSKNPRRLDIIKLPKGWGAGNCVIFVSCENNRDTSVFRYADVAREANRIIDKCIKEVPDRPGEPPYGGLVQVGDVGTFYVSVGRPTNRRPLAPGIAAMSSARNVTMS